MQIICPVCKEMTSHPHTIEVFLDQKGVYGIELCPSCKDKILGELPYFRPKAAPPIPEGAKIVTQEQLEQIMTGNLDPESLPDVIPNINHTADENPCECGQTISQLHNTGMLGCPKCYDHFGEEIDEFTTTYHGATEHKGKKPPKFTPKVEKIKILKLLLSKAKEVENYERAKELFDEIQAIEGKS